MGGLNQDRSETKPNTSAVITLPQKRILLIRFDFRGDLGSCNDRSMRNEDKSVSRVAIKQVRLRRISLFATNPECYSSTMTTSWNPVTYSKNARFVSELGEPLLLLLKPQAGEVILDLGCGDGALTRKLAAEGSSVIGIDASRSLLEAAHAWGLNVAVMDAQQLGLKRRFEAIFSNAALHWIKRPELVLDGAAKCLKPGGRFVGEFGGRGNVETIRTALHAALRTRGIDPSNTDPWYFPSADEYSALLGHFGFDVEYIELIPRATKLPGDILGWLEVFAQPFTNVVASSERSGFLLEVRDALEAKLRKTDGTWHADYVRLRFKAVR
jgi:trans-aconitate methyltransferase